MNNKKNLHQDEEISTQLDSLQKLTLYELLIYNSMEYAFLQLDLEGNIIDTNPCVEFIYGYPFSTCVGIKINAIYTPEENISPIDSLIKIVKKTGYWQGEMISTNKNGEKQVDFVVLIYAFNQEKQPIGYTLIAKPISQALQLQSQFAQESLQMRNKELEDINTKMHELSRLKNQFLANMSHDLRTPLNGIIGFAEIMYDEKVGPISNEHKEYLNEILSNANVLLLLINDILDIAKIEAGKMDFNPEKIKLYSLLDELRKIFNEIIIQKHINFEIKMDHDFTVHLDPTKLKQVLYNLVSNAFKFTNAGGTVKITVAKENKKHFRLAIKDTGIGIDKCDFKNLFVPFQQLKSDDAKEHPGTGLGLAIAHRIVNAQGGRIEVESTLGKGSTFSIILPCKAPAGQFGYILSEKPAKTKAPCILIVEKKSSDRDDLVADLTTTGYRVNVADNIEDAIANYQVQKADAIILDFFISDISKWRLLRAFRTKQPFKKAPALLITGGVASVRAFGFKIHDFLVQPVVPDELVEALEWSGAHPHTNKKVLIIDDDKKAIRVTSKILIKFGYYVKFETDLNKALQHIEQQYPDAIILNALMESENINGLDFLQYLRHSEKNRYTPILITTVKILTSEEQERIKGVIQRVLIKKEGIANSLLSEIKKQFPIQKSYKE